MRYLLLISLFVLFTGFSPDIETTEVEKKIQLWELSPTDFFMHTSVKQELDLRNPDNYLLSIAVFQATNHLRDQKNLSRFTPNIELHRAGKKHIDEMLTHNFFGHVNDYNQTYSTFDKRIKIEGGDFGYMAENLALLSSFDTEANKYQYRQVGSSYHFFDLHGRKLKLHTYESFAKEVVTEWYKSKGHRRNLFNPELSHIGIAVHIEPFQYNSHQLPNVYAVQEFGGY